MRTVLDVKAGTVGDDADFLDGACGDHRLEHFFIHLFSLGISRSVQEW